MDELCEKIDTVLLQFMETLSDLYKEQTRLEESMKAGYLNMSRARYNMGIRSVGIQQCDESKMSALVKVSLKDNSLILEDTSDLEVHLSDLDLGEEREKSGLRKRTVPGQNSSTNTSEDFSEKDKIEEIQMKSVKKTGLSDPLKWFGVLVPQSLRQSQSEFKSSIDTAVNVANIKSKLVDLQNQYAELLKEKKALGN